jgi:hypothetical protein
MFSSSDPAAVAEALKDFSLRGGEKGLSLYRVEGAAEAESLALEWALENRESDDNMDYAVFDQECLTGVAVQLKHEPDEQAKCALLRERHCELVELQSGGYRAVVCNVMEATSTVIRRIPKRDVAAERSRRTQ